MRRANDWDLLPKILTAENAAENAEKSEKNL